MPEMTLEYGRSKGKQANFVFRKLMEWCGIQHLNRSLVSLSQLRARLMEDTKK